MTEGLNITSFEPLRIVLIVPMDQQQAQQLVDEAKRRGVTPQAVAREMIEAMLEQRELVKVPTQPAH